MSKAKELARAIRLFPKSSYVWAVHDDLGELIDEVLSEPEPLRGWIEVGEKPYRQLLHLDSGKIFEEYAERVRVQGYGGYVDINSTFDDFKAKITRSV